MAVYMAYVFVFCFTLYHSITPNKANWYGGINGDYMLTLGNQNNYSELQLVGKVYKNFERNMSEVVKDARIEHLFSELCEAYSCGKWSTWSECSAKNGSFGMTSRSRTCGRNISACAFNDTKESVEKVSKLCLSRRDPTFVPTPETTTEAADTSGPTTEEITTQKLGTTWVPNECPDPYENVHGYCLHLITLFRYGYQQASMLCSWDGASLVHVDTIAKQDALEDLLLANGFEDSIWIDGRRANDGEDFIYTGEDEPDFDNWLPGQPETGADVCKADSSTGAPGSSTRGWEALPCNSQLYFVCEHPPL